MANKTRENVWVNIGFNIAVPSLLLIKGRRIMEMCGMANLDPDKSNFWVFVIALAFPIIYGIYDLAKRRKWNAISILGVVSVLLTGGIGLMKLSREYMIVKEGTIPLLIGAAVLATAPTRKPLAKILIMNDSLMDVEKVDALLVERGTREDFDKSMKSATYIVAASFLLSSVLNFALAYHIFQSPAGTEEFNAEVGRMTALSFPVIALPVTVIFMFACVKIFNAISRCTGLGIEDILLASKKEISESSEDRK